MPVAGYNAEKCEQRRRLSAYRYGIDAVPMKFRHATPGDVGDGFDAKKAHGSLPVDGSAALSAINSKLPDGAPRLSAEQVHIHYLEAANGSYIEDRSMFLGESTLKNIAADSQAGVAFMNSHHTGGMSSPSELPFGKTFAGQYQEGFDSKGNPARRSLIGVYMVRGVHPTGQNGPSTDDLNAMIQAGTVSDVSVGLHGGERICDVCGNGLFARDEDGEYLCDHVPGTHYGMKPEDIAAQKKANPANKKGFATFTLQDAHQGEVSAVYDGAVPGAGVRKVMAFAHGDDKEQVRAMLQEAYDYYGALLPFDLGEVIEIKPQGQLAKKPKKQSAQGVTMSWESFKHGMLQLLNSESGETAEATPPAQAVAPVAMNGFAAQPTARELELEKQLTELQAKQQQQQLEDFATKYAAKIPPAAMATALEGYTAAVAAGTGEQFAATLDAIYAIAPGAGPGDRLTAGTRPEPPTVAKQQESLAQRIVDAGAGKMPEGGYSAYQVGANGVGANGNGRGN